MTIRKILMTDLEEAQRAKIERLYGEIEKWKTKYFEQIKTDEEWERYIKKSREEAEEQRKRDLNYVVLGITWIATLMYLLFFE
jgi:tRNA U34 5-carboxymethylaminomethyl modifying enzyme MnmG/GidA